MITKFEDILITLEQAEKLKEAGVKQYSLFAWSYEKLKLISKDKKPFLLSDNEVSLFTNPELKSLLPLEYDGYNLVITRNNYGIKAMYVRYKYLASYPIAEYLYTSNSQNENDSLVDVLLFFYTRLKILPLSVGKSSESSKDKQRKNQPKIMPKFKEWQ